MTRTLYFLHGMEGNPQGFKANLLREHYPEVVVPALPNDLTERQRLQAEAIGENAVVVGSSLGGLSALLFARDYPEQLAGMALLAPAVGFHDASLRSPELIALVESLVIPAGIPTHVIMGQRDDVIPVEAVEALVNRSPSPELIHLTWVDDNHFLHSEEAVKALLSAVRTLMRDRAS